MSAISLKAHFDGKTIQLDEPYDLPANAQLIVTIVPATTVDDERRAWMQFSADGLARAYGDDEPEYSLSDLES
jgi:hypothetical protein